MILFSFTEGPVSVEIHRHTPHSPWTYSDLDQRQRNLASQIRQGTSSGVLLVSELAPVITRGRRTPTSDLLFPPEYYHQQGIQTLTTDRGGLATYHGPGQWVLFPVDRVEALTGDRRGIRKTIDGLLKIACQVGNLYHPSVHSQEGEHLGAWTSQGKFASVGIHVEDGIVLHGLSVNGFRTAQSFVGLRPCGLDTPMDYLLPEPNEAEFETLANLLISSALKTFWI